MPDPSNRRSTCTIIRSAALKAPSSQSASPRRSESSPSRWRMRSLTRGRRCSDHVLSRFHEFGDLEIDDRRLHRTQRGKHPRDGARPGIRIVGQQAGIALRDMEHDRAQLEQSEIALFIGRNLPERMKRTMRGFLHLAERNKTNVIRLAHFFERPANTHVARLPLAAIGRPCKGCDGRGHRKAPVDCMTLSRVRRLITTIVLMVRFRFRALHSQDE